MNAEFVCQMEEVLDIYKRPYDPKLPIVCVDESSKQLTKEVRESLPACPGQVLKYDTEYERNGTASIFMAFEPLQGQRFTKITEQRTQVGNNHEERPTLQSLSSTHLAVSFENRGVDQSERPTPTITQFDPFGDLI